MHTHVYKQTLTHTYMHTYTQAPLSGESEGWYKITDKKGKVVTGKNKLETLVNISINLQPISSHACVFPVLPSFAPQGLLTHIDLSGRNVTWPMLRYILEYAGKLKVLRLAGCVMQPDGSAVLAQVRRF